MVANKKRIRKVSQVSALDRGAIIDSLDGDSNKNAPSIGAVNKGKTSIKKDGVILRNANLNTTPMENGSIAYVQLCDDNGNVYYLETSYDQIKLGNTSYTMKDLSETVRDLINMCWFDSSPTVLINRLNTILPTETLEE